VDESKFWPNWEATRLSKLSEISPEEIQIYYDYFAEAHAAIRGRQDMTHVAAARMVSLRNYLDQRQIDDHHRQAQRLGRKTLFWARWAVAAAVVVPILVALILQLPPRPPQALPASSPQERPTAAPSATPLESPTPQAEK